MTTRRTQTNPTPTRPTPTRRHISPDAETIITDMFVGLAHTIASAGAIVLFVGAVFVLTNL